MHYWEFGTPARGSRGFEFKPHTSIGRSAAKRDLSSCARFRTLHGEAHTSCGMFLFLLDDRLFLCGSHDLQVDTFQLVGYRAFLGHLYSLMASHFLLHGPCPYVG